MYLLTDKMFYWKSCNASYSGMEKTNRNSDLERPHWSYGRILDWVLTI